MSTAGAEQALAAFLGTWIAEGQAYGGPDQSPDDPRRNPVPWTSTHVAAWHTGEFFLVQQETARPGGHVFDTLSVIGAGPAGGFVARTFENHGFYREYAVTRDGRTWTFSGASERATIAFSEDGRRQTIAWEWRPKDQWLPLCDRVAVRAD